jgi:hypothetical protein
MFRPAESCVLLEIVQVSSTRSHGYKILYGHHSRFLLRTDFSADRETRPLKKMVMRQALVNTDFNAPRISRRSAEQIPS